MQFINLTGIHKNSGYTVSHLFAYACIKVVGLPIEKEDKVEGIIEDDYCTRNAFRFVPVPQFAVELGGSIPQ